MINSVFFYSLALERCRYHLAQLCAVLLADPDRVPCGDESSQTVQDLLEGMGKDLNILNHFIEEKAGEL